MKNIREIVQEFTDYQKVMKVVRYILKELDPEFEKEEAAFLSGIAVLKEQALENMSISLDEVIEAEERRIAGNILFLAWRGLHLNLECFRDFTKNLFLKMDYDEIFQEEVMNSMPHGEDGYLLTSLFARELHERTQADDYPITSYYCYLESSAYKIVHCLSYIAGDFFLQYVEPGYIPNTATSCIYAMDLKRYCGIKIPH